jgi:hypothetical protein
VNNTWFFIVVGAVFAVVIVFSFLVKAYREKAVVPPIATPKPPLSPAPASKRTSVRAPGWVPLSEAIAKWNVPVRIVNRLDFPGSGYVKTDADIAFEGSLGRRFESIERVLYDSVAGINHPNSDGSKRLPVIRKCRELEFLLMVPDDLILDHPMAVTLHRAKGGQLGFLNARLAGELRRDGLDKWACVFRRKIYKPDTKIVRGAVICLVRIAA